MINEQLTRTEANILHLLSDGQYHHRSEIQKVIDSELPNEVSKSLLGIHLYRMRKKGCRIECDPRGSRTTRTTYFRLIPPPKDTGYEE